MMVSTKIVRTFQASTNRTVCNVEWIKSTEAMQKNFFSFLKRRKLSDCTLTADGKFIYAHRVILASSSLYFQKLFMSRPNDKDPVIHFNGISYVNLCMLMKYAYTGEVSMVESRVPGFLEAAKSLQMIGLMEKDEKPKTSIKDKKKKESATKRAHEDSVLSDASTVFLPETLKRIKLESSLTIQPIPIKGAESRKRIQSYEDSDDSSDDIFSPPGKVARKSPMRFRDRSVSASSDFSL